MVELNDRCFCYFTAAMLEPFVSIQSSINLVSELECEWTVSSKAMISIENVLLILSGAHN